MFAVRAFARRRVTPLLARVNATLSTDATTSSSAPLPSPPSLPQTKSAFSTSKKSDAAGSKTEQTPTAGGEEAQPIGRRRRRIVKRRAQISLTNPRKWNPPVKPGSLPVYDEALKLIKEDSMKLKRELHTVKATVANLEETLVSLGEAESEKREAVEKELREAREKVKILEIQSEVNLPWVRWYAANGMADLTKPVYRHLVEQKWRSYGDLDLLMERIYQMHVVPDLLPSLHPSLDLRLSFPEPPPSNTYLRTRTRRKYKPVEPGVFLLPEQTRRPPRLYTSVFHPETRYYTLVLLDADVPDPENQAFTTYLHWMQPNIALSASSCGALPTLAHSKYIPPHPQRGSPYHRYCLFLLSHANSSEKISVAPVPEDSRIGFNLRAFCEEYGLDASMGGGAHMWREEWDETVSDIYKHTLKRIEPHYGRPPRADPYADVKAVKKFVK